MTSVMNEFYHASQLNLFSDDDYIEINQLTLFDASEALTPIPRSRICTGCGVRKTLKENFNKHTRSKSGYREICKECRAKQRREAPPRQEWVEVSFKACPRCTNEKPIAEFAIDKNRRDSHAGWCKKCIQDNAKVRDYNKNRRERNKELGKEFAQQKYAKHKIWRAQNIDTLRVQWREKYANDPEYAARMRRHSEKWRKEHPLEWRAKQMKREARERDTATIEHINLRAVLSQHGMWCYICGQDILPSQDLTFDHVIPLAPRPGHPQGTHTSDNLRPAHGVCNRRKSNKQLSQLTEFDRRGPR